MNKVNKTGGEPASDELGRGDHFPQWQREAVIAMTVVALYLLFDWTTHPVRVSLLYGVWHPSAGLTFAVLYTFGFAGAIWIFLGTVVSSLFYQHSVLAVPAIAGEIVPILVYGSAACLLRKWGAAEAALQQLRNLIRYCGLAVCAALLVVSVDLAVQKWSGPVLPAQPLSLATRLWFGDCIALICLAPFLFLFVFPGVKKWLRGGRCLEFRDAAGQNRCVLRDWIFLAQIAALALGMWIAFTPSIWAGDRMVYVLFLPIFWIAIRCGLKATVINLVATNSIAAFWLAVVHADRSDPTGWQLPLLLLSITGMCLGALTSQNEEMRRTLAEGEEKIRLLFDSTSEAICGVDLDGICTFCNEAFLHAAGLKRSEDVIGLPVLRFFHGANGGARRFDAAFLREADSSHALQFESEIRSNGDRRLIPVDVWCHSISREGRRIGTVISFLDITAKAEAKREREEQAAFLNGLIRNNPLGVVVLDLQGRVQTCNPAFEEMFQYTQAEILGSKLDDLLACSMCRESALQTIRRAAAGETSRVITQRQRRDGTSIDIELHGAPMVVQGQVTGLLGIYQDISDRKRAEVAMRRAESRYRLLVEQLPAITYTAGFNDEAPWLYVSPQAEKLLGYSPQEWEADPALWLKLMVPEDRGGVLAALAHARETGEPFTADYRMYSRDGRMLWFRDSACIVGDDAGTTAVRQGVMLDVTDRKRAEEEVQKSNGVLQALFEASPIAILAADNEGRITTWNPAAEKMYGWTTEEVLHRPLHDFIGEDPGAVRGRVQELRHGTALISFEAKNTTKSNRQIDVIVSIAPLRDSYGAVTGGIGMVMDVSDRKRAEAEVYESNRILNAIIEGSPVAIISADKTGKVTTWNPAAEKIYGWKANEVIGRMLQEVVGGDTGTLHSKALEVLQGKELVSYEAERNRTKDNRQVYVSVLIAPLKDSQGMITGGIGMVTDISEQKRAEAELLRAKQAAESASRAKSEFLANMSHEIRTPMNGIIGMTELVLDTKLNPEQREYVRLARISAESLLTLINDILDFSKIEAGKLELYPVEFNLRNSLEETVKTLSMRANKKRLELALQVAPNLDGAFFGDSSRLRQILVNLAGNAIKFTEHGDVTVSVEQESETEDHVLLHFSVRDTGIGIPPEKQQMIFEPFMQADGSMTRRYGGTGLGLTITKRLVEVMGGRIWVQSEFGQGSTFHFLVKLRRLAERAQLQGSAEAQVLRGMPILVVDDNRTNRLILYGVVSSWGMQPRCAEDGDSALAILGRDQERFPVILLDSRMPKMDGFELSRIIRKQFPENGPIIMMLSSSDQPGDAARCRELGIEICLTKPIAKDELMRALLAALGKRESPATPIACPISPCVDKKTIGRRILVAEDNAVNRALILRLLEKAGHLPIVAKNGREAVAHAEKEDPDLIFMDVQMPEMDGYEATAAIRTLQGSAKRRVPIIAMTAYAMKGDRERCLAAGMDDYLSKPIRRADLYAKIEYWISRTITEATPVRADEPGARSEAEFEGKENAGEPVGVLAGESAEKNQCES